MTEPGQIVELEIQEVAYGGKGVARLEGKVWFVSGALPGETVQARVEQDHANFSAAVACEILSPSPARVSPVCPLAFQPAGCANLQRAPWRAHVMCPGCAYQHATYQEELRIKHAQLRDLLERQAHADPLLAAAPVPAPACVGYRNKIVLHAQRDGAATRLGYYMDDNVTVIHVPACPLAMQPLNDALGGLRAKPGFLGGLRDSTPVTLRFTPHGGAAWWRGQASDQDTWPVEATTLGPLSVPRNSFYQMNPAVGDLLVQDVASRLHAQPPRTVIDLFCGVGVFALAAAQAGVPAIIGIDADGPAIQAAEYNARQRGCSNLRWIAGNAAKALANLAPDLAREDTTLIVDPPRAGLGRNLVNMIARTPPGRIIYISCAADTMARDAAWLREAGYEVQHAQLFDMFPRTAHFESVTELRLMR